MLVMMEKQKKDCPSSASANGRAPVFRIPKKKADAWSEDVQMSSPLSRISEYEFKNVTTRKRSWAFSNGLINKTRNKDFSTCNISKSASPKSSSLQTCLQPTLVLTNVLKTDVGRQYMKSATMANLDVTGSLKMTRPPHILFSRQPKVILMDVLTTHLGREAIKKYIADTVSCNEPNIQISQIPSPTTNNPETCEVLDGRQESLCLSSRSEKDRRLSNETDDVKEKDTRSATPSRRCAKEQKEKEFLEQASPSKACRDVSNSPISSLKDGNRWNSKKCNPGQGKQDSKTDTVNECKESVKCSVISTMSKGTHEKTYCHRRVEQQLNKATLLTNVPSPSDKNSTQSSAEEANLDSSTNSSNVKTVSTVEVKEESSLHDEKINDGVLPTSKKPIHHTNVQVKIMKRRNLPKSQHRREEPSSTEPIVLSSDEEERECGENTAAVPGQVLEEPLTKMEETDKSVDHHQASDENNTTETMCHADNSNKVMVLNKTTEFPVLELKFANVYFGRKKGRAHGTAKFTAKSIDIPLTVALQKSTCMTVDTMKLQKYGLWIMNEEESVKSSAVIFLWVTEDYVPHLELQIGASQTSAANKFIFLELCDIPTKREQELLCDIMNEASKTSLPVLSDSMSWEKAFPLLKNLSNEESSFMANCFAAFKKPQPQQSVVTAIPEYVPQGSKKEHNPPAYTLLQSYKDDIYSVSLVPKRGSGWKEVQSSGSLLKLIVYPPPPTKGGLGVTNEDLECLEHGEFLNDVIIDFYLKYLLLEKFPKDFAERSHMFSSFFFKCLTRKDNGTDDCNMNISAAERRHQGVKTWTRHVDIFTKDFIFVPVNEKSHWYLIVICFPWLQEVVYEDSKAQTSCQPHSRLPRETSSKDSVIVFNNKLAKEEETMEEESMGPTEGTDDHSADSGSGSSEKANEAEKRQSGKVCKRPCLLIFDSLKTGSVQHTVQILREYLKVEWHMKRKSAREFSRSHMRDFYPKVPKQNNSTDCGLYLLQYVESFAQKPIESFDPPMHLENWFPSHVVKRKRDEIKDLILQLHLQQKSGKP